MVNRNLRLCVLHKGPRGLQSPATQQGQFRQLDSKSAKSGQHHLVQHVPFPGV